MLSQLISAVVILGIAILFLNPGHLAMPDSVVSMMTLGIIIAFFLFAAFLLREKPSDEREGYHILTAGRVSYLMGVGTLILAIIIQGFSHNIDPWLVIVLCIMIFSKLITRIYSHFKM